MNENEVLLPINSLQHQALMSAVIHAMETIEFACPIIQELQSIPDQSIYQKYQSLQEVRTQLSALWENRFVSVPEPIETPNPDDAEVIIP